MYVHAYIHAYRIRSTFGSDFNLAVWQFWIQSLNLMYANTKLHVLIISQGIYAQNHPDHQTAL